MTFDNTPEGNDRNKELESEKRDRKRFRNIIIAIITVLLLILLYLLISHFISKSKTKIDLNNESTDLNQIEVRDENKESITTTTDYLADETGYDDTNESPSVKENTELIKQIEERDIFQISSKHPTGLYVMVGSFSIYDNARRLEKSNPTDFVCYIFEPNYNDLNRVGLYISEDDLRKTDNALKEIRNMQPESWLLYNTQN